MSAWQRRNDKATVPHCYEPQSWYLTIMELIPYYHRADTLLSWRTCLWFHHHIVWQPVFIATSLHHITALHCTMTVMALVLLLYRWPLFQSVMAASWDFWSVTAVFGLLQLLPTMIHRLLKSSSSENLWAGTLLPWRMCVRFIAQCHIIWQPAFITTLLHCCITSHNNLKPMSRADTLLSQS